MGLRVKIGLSKEYAVIMIVMPIDSYNEVYRGALMMYGCEGRDVENPVATYIVEALKYLKHIKSCREV